MKVLGSIFWVERPRALLVLLDLLSFLFLKVLCPLLSFDTVIIEFSSVGSKLKVHRIIAQMFILTASLINSPSWVDAMPPNSCFPMLDPQIYGSVVM